MSLGPTGVNNVITKYLIIAKSNDPLNMPKVFAGWGFQLPVWNKAPTPGDQYGHPTMVMFDSFALADSQEQIIARDGTAPDGYTAMVVECQFRCLSLDFN
jgi:hypothetical protein